MKDKPRLFLQVGQPGAQYIGDSGQLIQEHNKIFRAGICRGWNQQSFESIAPCLNSYVPWGIQLVARERLALHFDPLKNLGIREVQHTFYIHFQLVNPRGTCRKLRWINTTLPQSPCNLLAGSYWIKRCIKGAEFDGSIETSTRPQASNGSNGIHAVTYDSIYQCLDTNPGKIRRQCQLDVDSLLNCLKV